MIYVKSMFVGIVCVAVTSFLVATVIVAYPSVVYHVGIGPILWKSHFGPFDWLFTFVVFSGGFLWEFRRARPKQMRQRADVFKTAKISDGHSHRFRDTFAVELLQAGVSLENVSTLLGHQNIRVTEEHYSPWVQTRQAMLDDEVRRATARAEMAEGG